MRNIKSTLRFVRNSALLFVAASGMTYLTACSETDITPDNGGNNGGDENVLVEQLKVTTGSNPSLAKSYYNSHLSTRASFDVPEHPGMPKTVPASYDITLDQGFMSNPWAVTVDLPASAIEADYANLSDLSGLTVYAPAGTYNSLPAEFNVNYVHQYASGENGYWSKQVKVTNPKYYINGDVTVGGFGNNGSLEIHILKGGSIKANKEFEYDNVVYLYEGGKLLRSKSNDDDNQIYLKNTVYSEENIGSDEATIIMDSAKVYTYGKIQGKNVSAINNTELYAGCAVTAVEQVYITNNAKVCAGYISAPTVKLDSNAHILLRDGAYVNATEILDLENIGTCLVEAEDGEYAMIETETVKVNLIDLQGSFYNVAIKFENATGDNRTGEHGEGLLWNNTCQVNGDIVDYDVVDGNDCGPKMVVNPNDNPTPDPDPVLENIGSVAPSDADHTHPISATCIYTNGQDAYLSWHTQGPNFHGCIEYLTVANGTVTLNSWLETSPSNDTYGAVDFNHVIFDNGKIFVAGDHPKKGGILGWIECNDGKFVTGEAVLNIRQLYNEQGGSGNCIIRNGEYYQVASVKGFETFNVSDFTSGAKPKSIAKLAAYDFDPAGVTADGNKISGKHIATDGQNVVMLTLINRDNDANTATASIKVYAASDVTYENEIASYTVEDAVLAPVDGKDVIAIQGSDIYVCLGQGGVQKLTLAGNKITKAAEFVILNQDKATDGLTPKERAACCANGLAVDSKYVYVAHGGAGLVVLNKSDLSYVTRTRYNGGNSANYVNLNPDGYIYVAYGKSNVQVFAWKK